MEKIMFLDLICEMVFWIAYNFIFKLVSEGF